MTRRWLSVVGIGHPVGLQQSHLTVSSNQGNRAGDDLILDRACDEFIDPFQAGRREPQFLGVAFGQSLCGQFACVKKESDE